MRGPIASPVLLALLVSCGLSGCSFGVFSELEEKAPATRITQDGEISSSSYGDHLVGNDRGDGNTGGLLTITGNGDAALTTVTFSAAGEAGAAHSDRDNLKEELDDPLRITAMAPAPSDNAVGSAQGPFVYAGSTSHDVGTVRVLDVITLRRLHAIYEAPSPSPVTVTDFGLAVAPADLGDGGSRDDLAVGAKNAVVLMRAVSGAWPDMQQDQAVTVSGGTDWPEGGSFTVLATGNLDTSTVEDEVVAATPEHSAGKGAVVIVHHTAECFVDPAIACQSHRVLPVPQGAGRFGAALLVADVDEDNQLELVVGAPDADSVFVYDLEEKHFDPVAPDPLPTPKTLSGGKEFGASLAFGKVAGGAKNLLVVGAPGAAAGGVAAAGQLHLFGSDLKPIGEAVALVNADDKMMLGRRLAVLPFRASGNAAPLDVLAASGRDAVFIFFANLTSGHKDIRVR